MSYTLLIAISIVSGLLIFLPGFSASKSIKSVLSFSGSFLLSICFIHILPEVFKGSSASDATYLGAYLMMGFFLQLILDYFSGGIEHGHAHVNHNRLGHFPFLVFLSLCTHAFLEALPIEHFEGEAHNHSLLLGLVVHKAPISFILASFLLGYQLKRIYIVLGILFFSLSAPLGMWLGSEMILDIELFSKILAISAGIILHLSTTILLESNEEHQIKLKKLLPMLFGALLALCTLL